MKRHLGTSFHRSLRVLRAGCRAARLLGYGGDALLLPEPGSPALVGAGLLGLGLLRRRSA